MIDVVYSVRLCGCIGDAMLAVRQRPNFAGRYCMSPRDTSATWRVWTSEVVPCVTHKNVVPPLLIVRGRMDECMPVKGRLASR